MSMNDNASLNQTVFHLFAERQAYVSRLNELAGDPSKTSEVDGYLRLIDGVNAALRNLASRVPLAHGV